MSYVNIIDIMLDYFLNKYHGSKVLLTKVS